MKLRDRCDHCQKFVSEKHGLFTLEGIVSSDLPIEHSICERCFKSHSSEDLDYWNSWLKTKVAK